MYMCCTNTQTNKHAAESKGGGGLFCREGLKQLGRRLKPNASPHAQAVEQLQKDGWWWWCNVGVRNDDVAAVGNLQHAVCRSSRP